MPTGLDLPTPTAEMIEIARRPLETEQCALILIDVQEKLLPLIFHKEQLVKNAQLLTRLAGILKIPTIATTQYAKGLGNTVPELQSLVGESGIDKQVFSCALAAMFSARY